MNNSKLPPSVELDGPRLDEVKALAKVLWEAKQAWLASNDPADEYQAMASAALEHGRSSETVDQANERYALLLEDEAAKQPHVFGSGSNLLAAAMQAGAKALRAVRAESPARRSSAPRKHRNGCKSLDCCQATKHGDPCGWHQSHPIHDDPEGKGHEFLAGPCDCQPSPALGGERSPQSEAVEQADLIALLENAHRELCEAVRRQWDGGHALKLSIPARPDHDTDLIIGAALREAIAAVRQAERSSEPAGLTTGTEAK